MADVCSSHDPHLTQVAAERPADGTAAARSGTAGPTVVTADECGGTCAARVERS